MRIARDVVAVSGTDACSFLQGQLSQDVEAIEPGGGAWSLILQPQGKVDAWVRVARLADASFLLDVDRGYGNAVLARLDRFKLRVRAELESLGLRACDVDESADLEAPLSALRPVRLDAEPADVAPSDEWDALRVRLGIPAMGRELTADTIPEEVGLVDVSVSFTKGCYTGQELVARIDSRGRNVPRRLRRVVLEDDDGTLSDGDALEADGRVVGSVTTAAGATALAFVGRAVQPGARVATPGGVARVDGLPPLR